MIFIIHLQFRFIENWHRASQSRLNLSKAVTQNELGVLSFTIPNHLIC